MTYLEYDFDDLQEEFGITFGLGIDIDAQHDAFKNYSAYGGQEENSATKNLFLSDNGKEISEYKIRAHPL
uniref:hypothetical protein n=1 Tax=Marinobacterium profundum TaxID=1714300 RepID=UPI000833DFB5|nr:hypothetical protein [Marinobacterium profundum]